MKIKSKLILIITMSVVLFLLTACTVSDKNSNSENNNLKIVTTLFPQYDFARQITGDNGDVSLLLTPGAESHTYEPTPKDVLKIQNADIFIYVGGESEVWVDDVLKSANNENLKTLRLMDYVTPIKEEDSDEEEYDEHIFTSLKNSSLILEQICSAICEIDSKNSELYQKNTDDYMQKISVLDEKFTEMTKNSKRQTIVFGDRFPFAYFAKDYNLKCYAAFTGCGSETEAGSANMSNLINIVKTENIPVVFYIEFSSQSVADKIANAAGAKTLLLHSCHNVSKEDIENEVTYADIMEKNYSNLLEALN